MRRQKFSDGFFSDKESNDSIESVPKGSVNSSRSILDSKVVLQPIGEHEQELQELPSVSSHSSFKSSSDAAPKVDRAEKSPPVDFSANLPRKIVINSDNETED